MMIAHSNKLKGFSLIEVLVAVLILAVGLLGFAALQMGAISSSEEGYMRTQATHLAENLSTRMRANWSFINDNTAGTQRTYVINNVGAAFGNYIRYCGTGAAFANEAAPPLNCQANFCNSIQRALWDRREICDELRAAQLPDAEIGVQCFDRIAADGDPCTANSRHTIYVAWQPSVRVDRGERTVVQNANGVCAQEMGINDTRSCITFEVVP